MKTRHSLLSIIVLTFLAAYILDYKTTSNVEEQVWKTTTIAAGDPKENNKIYEGPARTPEYREIDRPMGIAVSNQGVIYFSNRSVISRIDRSGNIVVLAGQVDKGFRDGCKDSARFNRPMQIAFNSKGYLFVADSGNHAIRRISPQGVVDTFAGCFKGNRDGIGKQARFDNPTGLVIDSKDNVYVSDIGNYNIRKITPDGKVTTYAGSGLEGFRDGYRLNAQFCYPYTIDLDKKGNLYITDVYNKAIRKISVMGQVSTISNSSSENFLPTAITLDDFGNIFFYEAYNSVLMKMNPKGVMYVITREQNDEIGSIHSLAMNSDRSLYAVDLMKNRISKIRSF